MSDWDDWGWPRPEGVEPEWGVVHRTGNPRADADANLAHSRKTKSWSIHHIVDRKGAQDAVPHDRVAWHVKEHRIARRLGLPIFVPGVSAPRGDVAAIGIETCEDDAVPRKEGDLGQKTIPADIDDIQYDSDGLPRLFASPSQTMRFSDATYVNLVELCRRLLKQYPNLKLCGHGHLDVWTRNIDPFGLLPLGWDPFIQAVRADRSRASGDPILAAVNEAERQLAEIKRLAQSL